MDKLDPHARASVRASLFEIETPRHSPDDPRGRTQASRQRLVKAPPPADAIDATQARAACKPMGELEYIVQAADGHDRLRTLYVIVPDLAMQAHYQRLGFEVEAGCRVLIDAAALTPIAVLRVSAVGSTPAASRGATSAGFNPYFDMRSST